MIFSGPGRAAYAAGIDEEKGRYGMGDTLQILVAMVIYMALVIILGVTFAKRANASSDAYFLGGRSLGPWVTAMSAEASDMSGWLLMEAGYRL